MYRREEGKTVHTSVPGTKRYAPESTFDSVGQDRGVTRQEVDTTLVPTRASQVRGHADTSRRPGAWAGGVDSQCGRRTKHRGSGLRRSSSVVFRLRAMMG